MQSLNRRIIGIDFDNTIVNYNELIYSTARHRGLIPAGVVKNKKEIRDAVRKLPDGEIEWQRLQAFIYGKGMENAVLMDGVADFFDLCKRLNVPAFIVSHKTQFASMDLQRVDLRQTALQWMKTNKFFSQDGFGLALDNIYFESTRQGKINSLRALGCAYFIDDLEETFLESSFPSEVEKILFSPQGSDINIPDIKVFQSWQQINDYFFRN